MKFDKIKTLQPDLIIANKEENEREQIEELAKEYPVWISDVRTLEQAFEMMKGIGEITGKEKEAERQIKKIRNRFEVFEKKEKSVIRHSLFVNQRVAYLIWRNPYMAAGGDTFIDDMLQRCRLKNVFSAKGRYPEVTREDIQAAAPEVVLLSSEPYPFKEKHIDELQEILPQSKIMLVDGELFSWYGSRLLHTPSYLQEVLLKIQ